MNVIVCIRKHSLNSGTIPMTIFGSFPFYSLRRFMAHISFSRICLFFRVSLFHNMSSVYERLAIIPKHIAEIVPHI